MAYSTRRMALGNNYLQAGAYVQVIAFDPPDQDGQPGVLRVRCPTAEKYEELRRFVDEEHGSALRSPDGGVWYLHRLSDDGQPEQPFPQEVTVNVEWRYR